MATTVDIATVQGVRDLLSLLETEKEIVLTDGSTAVAKLAAIPQVYPPKDGRIPDMYPNVWVSDDFDEPVPEQYWTTRRL